MDQEQQSRWRPTRTQLLWAGGIAALAFLIIVICGYLFGWKWTGLPKQTLWDWLQLLIIPAVLAGVGLWFNRQQREQELQTADRRAQDEALQAYLDQMSDMLIPSSKDLPSLYKARPGDSLSSVARARTLTVLPRLDGGRKARVVQFLYESGLIYKEQTLLNEADLIERRHSIVSLLQATLSGATLSFANLRRADLRGADLSGADLSGAKGWTEKQLTAAQTLEDATMPDGQHLKSDLYPDGPTFAEWLKSRGKGDSATPEQRGPCATRSGCTRWRSPTTTTPPRYRASPTSLWTGARSPSTSKPRR